MPINVLTYSLDHSLCTVCDLSLLEVVKVLVLFLMLQVWMTHWMRSRTVRS